MLSTPPESPVSRSHAGTRRAINGLGLHVDERGEGAAILCIHGAGGSALTWADAVARLAGIGHVIAYDRRGCTRSERPPSYQRTSVREHGDDAAALLRALDAPPAVVIGRSYGGSVALDLALRHSDRVRALVLLEPDAPRDLAPATAAWIDGLAAELEAIAHREGPDSPGIAEALFDAVLGPGTWPELPAELREILAGNAPAILAELSGEWWPEADAEALGALDLPVLILAASASRAELREPALALARAIPGACLEEVGGGHLIDPAAPPVLAFVERVLAGEAR